MSYLSFVQVYGPKYLFSCAFAATVLVHCSFSYVWNFVSAGGSRELTIGLVLIVELSIES